MKEERGQTISFLHIYFYAVKLGILIWKCMGTDYHLEHCLKGHLEKLVLALLFSFRDDPLVLLHVKMNFIGLVDCEGLRKPVWSEHRKGHNNPPTNEDFKMFNGRLSNRKKRQSQLVY